MRVFDGNGLWLDFGVHDDCLTVLFGGVCLSSRLE
jgi:hypothetical protein